MATYTYPITAFPNDTVAPSKLDNEIFDTLGVSATGGTTSHNGVVSIGFTGILTPPQQADLDGIVAAHDGVAEVFFPTMTVERTNTFTSTASAYTEVLRLNVTVPEKADYRLQWFTLYGIDSGLVNFRMRIKQDDEEIPLMGYTEEVPNSDPDERIPRSGFIPLKKLKKGNHHFDLECGKESGGEDAWKIYKAFMELRRV
jgi:hypothetical protein